MYRLRFRVCSIMALALLAAGLLGGCGGQRKADSSPPPSGLPLPQGLDALPRSGSAGMKQRSGADFESGMPHQNVSSEGSLGLYQPLDSGYSGTAFAIYTFDAGSHRGPAQLSYVWLEPAPPPADSFFALANFDNNAWDWRSSDGSGAFSIDSLAPNLSPGGLVYLLVLLQGTEPASLISLSLDTQLTYDEVENNDTAEAAQVLPPAPVRNFRCSLGSAPQYPGNDGDTEDWFRFFIPREQVMTVSFEERSDSLPWTQYMEVLDTLGNVIDVPGGFDWGSPSACYDINGGASGRSVLIRVSAIQGLAHGDYGLSVYTSSYFDFGGQTPAYSVLDLQPKSGSGPLTVTLDGSGCYNDFGETMERFLWDWEGDGHFDFDSGSSPVVQHTYTQAGVYHPTLRAFDIRGIPTFNDFDLALPYTYVPKARKTVTVGEVPYDEREDNDQWWSDWTGNEADLLPALPFSGWRGSIGGDGAGYDGDNIDCFELQAMPGQTLHITAQYTPSDVDFSLGYGLTDVGEDLLEGSSGQAAISHLVEGSGLQTIFVVIRGGGSSNCEYELAVSLE